MKSEQHFAAIAALDLDPIKIKLMHKESGEGWSLAYAEEIEFEYRRFLFLVKQFPHEQVAPLFDVDVFWHYHILDTIKYAADCDMVFGYFLHHFPYVGLRGKDDAEAHQRIGERMRELYKHVYGDQFIGRDPSAHPARLATPDSAPRPGIAWSLPTTDFISPASTSSGHAAHRPKADCAPPSGIAWSLPATNFISPASTSSAHPAHRAKADGAPPSGVAWSLPATNFISPALTSTDGSRAFSVDGGPVDASALAARAMFYSVRPTLSGLV